MKILHVETGRHLYGGAQQVLYLVSALAARGHDCTLVCPPDAAIGTAARAQGIPVVEFACAGDLDAVFGMRLKRFLERERYDLVHCHSRRGADILGGRAARAAGVPAVVSRRVDNREPAFLAAFRYRPFAKIIAISEAVAASLAAQGIDGERVRVVRSAVDADALGASPDCSAFRAEFAIPDDGLAVAAAGQLIERKGHRFLVSAVAELRERHPGLRLLLFGAGPLEQALREQVVALGLADVVRFPGFRDDLDARLACVDIFVHPALAEGLGVAALKAAAAGVPVIAFEAGGLTESVVDGETGLLVPPADTAGLVAAIDRLATAPGLRRSMGAAGRARMQKEFSIATMTDKHLGLYESVLATRPE